MKPGTTQRLLGMLALLVASAVGVSGCASEAVTRAMTSGPMTVQADYVPGGGEYRYGVAQGIEAFQNVAIAQDAYGVSTLRLRWSVLTPGRSASATVGGLQRYYHLNVRWKLKDGREFILQDIDVRQIMQGYFKSNTVLTQWEKEGRKKAPLGDYWPMLAVEVKDDTASIMWIITTNHTPVDQRLTPKGAATQWKYSDERFIAATLKGTPTQGLNFEDRYQFKK